MAQPVRYTNELESPIVRCTVMLHASLCFACCVVELTVLRLLGRKIFYKIRMLYVLARSKPNMCGRVIAGIAGSKPTEGMDVRLLCSLCVM